MKRMMERSPVPNSSSRKIRSDNINLRATQDMAWVTFDQYGPQTGDLAFDVPGLQKEMRILEKHDREWKIASCCNLQHSLDYVRSPLIRVDESSTVLWTNTAASRRLRNQDTLVVRFGHLHAIDRADDQRLQAAIRWASNRDNDPGARFIAVNGGALPVLLGGGGVEPTTMCWVITNSGMILVS